MGVAPVAALSGVLLDTERLVGASNTASIRGFISCGRIQWHRQGEVLRGLAHPPLLLT